MSLSTASAGPSATMVMASASLRSPSETFSWLRSYGYLTSYWSLRSAWAEWSEPSAEDAFSPNRAFDPAGVTSVRSSSTASLPASAPAGSRATPNFWSSCAVDTNSWPPAWMPDVTRSMTRARLPRRLAMVAIRSGSPGSSTTILLKPCSMASSISASDLLLPCSTSRRPGTPAASAMRISPMEQVSMSMPDSVTIRQISLLSSALPAKLTWVTVLLNALAAECTNFVARSRTSSVSMT